MTTPATPSGQPKSGDDRNLVRLDETTAATAQDQLEVWWAKNQKLVYGVCLAGLVVVGAKLGWDYVSHQRELGIEADYAKVATAEQRKAFVAAHAGHALAGIAEIELADEAYAAGKYADALAGYEKTAGVLKAGPLATRAQIGRAIAKLKAGKAPEGAAELKQIAGDTKLPTVARAEANYHLANLAAEAKDSAEVQKISDQLNQLDPGGIFAARVMALRASLPVAPAPAAPAAAPAKKDEASSSIQIKVPGK